VIIAGAAIVFREAPFGGDQPLLHAVERGIEGAFLDAQEVL